MTRSVVLAIALAVAMVAAGLATNATVGVAAGSHLPASTRWDDPAQGLTRVNALRAEAGLAPVSLDPGLSHDAEEAARYMAENDTLTHYPSPSKPYYTEAAAASAKASIMALGQTTWEQAVDGFAVTPFHRFPLLEPGLQAVGIGSYEDAWVIDTKRGAKANVAGPQPLLLPGPGDTAPASKWNGWETPDPLATCGESRGPENPVGPSITAQFAQVPRLRSATVRTESGRPVPVCARDTYTFSGRSSAETDMGRLFLEVYRGVYAIPLEPLVAGDWYDVSIDTDQGALSWRFRAPFADEHAESAFEFDIEWMGEQGVSSGTSGGCENSLSPTTYSALTSPGAAAYCWRDGLTRGQMATFLARTFELAAAKRDYFSDDNASVHEAAINSLAASGIAAGCGGHRFCPGERLTRGQMATFLARALDLPPAARDHFGDDNGHVHEGSINRLADAGITGGCATGSYCPNATLTRGQMAAFLHRAAG